MEDLVNIGKFIAIFCVVILFILMIFGPYLDLSARVEKLEMYHSNICSECGQVLHK